MNTYPQRLMAAIRSRGNPVCVGLDPRWESLPESCRRWGSIRAGTIVEQRALAYEEFCSRIVDVVAGKVPVVKPQVAFFEECGPAGMVALWRVMRRARQAGLLVICDAKRGDIGSTAEAYAQAYLGDEGTGPGNGGVDALTVNPYLGRDTLEPFVKTAAESGCGLYVLVRTSNPGAGTFQDLRDGSGKTVYQRVAEMVEEMACATCGEGSYGLVGAVVGATYPRELAALRQGMPHAPLLIPGYGSQGAKAADVAPAFGADGVGGVINSSRAIIFAHQRKDYRDRFSPEQWEQAVAAATDEMIAELSLYCQPR